MTRFTVEAETAVITFGELDQFTLQSVRATFEQFVFAAQDTEAIKAFILSCGFAEGIALVTNAVLCPASDVSGPVNYLVAYISTLKKPKLGMATGIVLGTHFCILHQCDMIFTDQSARFVFDTATTDDAAVQALVRRLGWRVAMPILTSDSKAISAQEAVRLGLVRKILPRGDFRGALLEYTTSGRQHGGVLAPHPFNPPLRIPMPIRLLPRHNRPKRCLMDQVEFPERFFRPPPQGGNPNAKPARQQPAVEFPEGFFRPPPQEGSPDAKPPRQQPAERTRSPDMAEWSPIHGQPITTVMIRNLPRSLTLTMLLEALDENGFKDKYDFVHLPSGGRPSSERSDNLAYGFVNFMDSVDAVKFAKVFTGYTFIPEDRPCAVHLAALQGKEANLEHLARIPHTHPSRRPYVRFTSAHAVSESALSVSDHSTEEGTGSDKPGSSGDGQQSASASNTSSRIAASVDSCSLGEGPCRATSRTRTRRTAPLSGA